jgi:hypothetical protein
VFYRLSFFCVVIVCRVHVHAAGRREERRVQLRRGAARDPHRPAACGAGVRGGQQHRGLGAVQGCRRRRGRAARRDGSVGGRGRRRRGGAGRGGAGAASGDALHQPVPAGAAVHEGRLVHAPGGQKRPEAGGGGE